MSDGSERDSSCHHVALLETTPCTCHSHYSSPASPWSVCVVGGLRRQGHPEVQFGSSARRGSATNDHDAENWNFITSQVLKANNRRGSSINTESSSFFGSYSYEYPTIENHGLPLSTSQAKNSSGDVTKVELDNYYYTRDRHSQPELMTPTDSDTESQSALLIHSYADSQQMEKEIREELSNEISFLDLEPSFLSLREGGEEGDGEMQKKGLCGVGARYRSLRCIRDDDVIVHPRWVVPSLVSLPSCKLRMGCT